MKKIYTLVLMAFLGSGSVMAQIPGWGFSGPAMQGDWRANVAALYATRLEYKIWAAPATWDATTSNVMDIWDKIPVGYPLSKVFVGKRAPESAADFTGTVKYMYDLDNLYVMFKATDDYIYPADSSKQESFEVMYSPYSDSIPMASCKALDTAFAASAAAADYRQTIAYWTKAGAIKTSFNALGSNSYVDFSKAWNGGIVNWGAPAANLNLTTKFTKINATEYTFMAIIPFDVAMGGFIPEPDKTMALELKVVDKDPGKKDIQIASNTDINELYIQIVYAGLGKFSADIAGGNVGLKQTPSAKFSVYPNPAADQIRITNFNKVNKVVITNLLGQEVRTFNTVTSSLELGNLNKGVYLVRMYGDNNSSATQKIIVK